jgi:hypothetical protein
MVKKSKTLGVLVGMIRDGTFDPMLIDPSINNINYESYSDAEREAMVSSFINDVGITGYRNALKLAASITGLSSAAIEGAVDEDLLSDKTFQNILIKAALRDKSINAKINKAIHKYKDRLAEETLHHKPTSEQLDQLGIKLDWRDRIALADDMPAKPKAEMEKALDLLYNNPAGQLDLLSMQHAFKNKKIKLLYGEGASTAVGLEIRIGENTFKHKYLREDGTYVAACMLHVLAHEIRHVACSEKMEDEVSHDTNVIMARLDKTQIPNEWLEDITKPRVGQIFYNAGTPDAGKAKNPMQAKITGVNQLLAKITEATAGGFSPEEQKEFAEIARGLGVKLEMTADKATISVPGIQRHNKELASVQVNCKGSKKVTQVQI